MNQRGGMRAGMGAVLVISLATAGCVVVPDQRHYVGRGDGRTARAARRSHRRTAVARIGVGWVAIGIGSAIEYMGRGHWEGPHPDIIGWLINGCARVMVGG